MVDGGETQSGMSQCMYVVKQGRLRDEGCCRPSGLQNRYPASIRCSTIAPNRVSEGQKRRPISLPTLLGTLPLTLTGTGTLHLWRSPRFDDAALRSFSAASGPTSSSTETPHYPQTMRHPLPPKPTVISGATKPSNPMQKPRSAAS